MGSARKNNPAYLYSRADGDSLIGEAKGLARLTPSIYFGDSSPYGNGVANYMSAPQLNHFRVQVNEIRGDDNSSPRGRASDSSIGGGGQSILDLDTRSLYFGQTNVSPAYASTICGGTYSDKPEGSTVAGLPVRFQQVSFRAFPPRGQSTEYTAFFLVSNSIQGYGAHNSQTQLPSSEKIIDSEYALHRAGALETRWTNNQWMRGGGKSDAKYDFNTRLIMGDPLMTRDTLAYSYSQLYSTQYFDGLGWNTEEKISTYDEEDSWGYKNNTFQLRFDKTSLITRQTHLEGDTWAEGWNYALPFDASIAARWTFYSGKYLKNGDAGFTYTPSDSSPQAVIPEKEFQSGDHWDIMYHTVPDANGNTLYVDTTAEEVMLFNESFPYGKSVGGDPYNMKIMRRFKPAIGHIYGCLDGNNWTLIPLIGGSVSDDHSITNIKTSYATAIVQAGSNYSFEVELIESKYVIRAGRVHVFNKSVDVGEAEISPSANVGAATNIWLKVWVDQLAENDIRDGKLEYKYVYGRDPIKDRQGPELERDHEHVQWYLIADTKANWGGGGEGQNQVPVKQHILGDIYDRNVPVPYLWPVGCTDGNTFDVLQLDDKDGPAKWYTLRAQSFFADEE